MLAIETVFFTKLPKHEFRLTPHASRLTPRVESSISSTSFFKLGLLFLISLLLEVPTWAVASRSFLAPPDTIYIDIACIGDKELYLRNGGPTDPLAETKAMNYMNTIMNRVSARYEPIFNTYAPNDRIYKFRIVTNDVIKDDYPLYGGVQKNLVIWGNHKNFWNDKYPCADDVPDIIHVFSGRSVGQLLAPAGQSFYGWSAGSIYNNNTQCLLGNSITLHGIVGTNGTISDSLRNLALTAHEMGHNFGLDHLESVSANGCDTLCNTPHLMCSSNNISTLLSSCDYQELQNTLTAPTIISCLKAPVQATVDSNCMHCKVTVMAMSDKDVLAFGCDGYEEFEFTSEIWHNCDSSDRKIKFEINKNALEVIDPGIFTPVVVGSLIELRRIVDGQESAVTFGPEEKKVFKMKFKIKDLSNLTITNLFVRTRVFTNGGAQIAFNERVIPFAVQTGTSPNSTISLFPATETAILLNGQLNLSSPTVLTNPNLRYIFCAPGSGIQINNQKTVFHDIQILGCNSMWKGLTINSGSFFEMDMASIQDAQFGVTIHKGATLVSKNNMFLNNNVSIKTDPSGTGVYSITLLSNEYGTTGTGLKPVYSGQTPLPDGKGFAAVYLKNAGAVEVDSDPGSGAPNRFYNLKFGVLSYNTELDVHNGTFENITQVPKVSGYDALATVPTGKAIYQEKGSGYLIGGPSSANPAFSFQNCHTGIEAFGGNTFVLNAAMNEVNNGIVATNNKLITCADNHIVAAEKGIDIRHLVPFLPPQTSTVPLDFGLYTNDIEISDHAQGVGININGIYKTQGASSLQNPAFESGILSHNSLTMSTGATGIYLNNTAGTRAYGNTVSLSNTQNNRYGIYLAGGENNKLSCNDVSGAGHAAGLYAIHPSKAGILCNNAEDLAEGLHLEGMLVGKENAVVAGNTLIDATTGLLYGVDAITGEQKHRGNRWQGSNTLATHLGGGNVADASRYTVDAAENPDYLPDFWAPLAWFTDEDAEQDSTYQCPTLGFCSDENPATTFSGGEDLDIRIAKEELQGEAYQAANNWLAQRRLYERLDEEGNPYPNNTDMTAFLSAAQTNGIAAYANLQTGIRQIFEIDETDRDSFELYERRIVGGLEDLAGLAQQLHTPGISTQDSSSLATQVATARQTIQTAATAKASLLDLMDSLRAVAAGALWTQNSSLPDLEVAYADNEKVVNDIFLRSVARNVFAFAAQDSNALEAIAAQCPLSGGEAVLRARSLLALVVDGPVAYDDEAACDTERGRRPSRTAAGLRVYPNPTRDMIVLEYPARDQVAQTFLLFNALGQVAARMELPEGQGTVQMPLKGLADGVYWYQLSQQNQPALTGKIIIQH